MNIRGIWTDYIKNISVRRKLNLLTALIALGVIALSVIAARIQYLDLYSTRLATVHAHAEAGNSVLEHYAALADSGQLSLQQAQAQAIETLASMRAPSSGMYYTVLDTGNDTLVMHPFRRESAGTALAEYKDEAGVAYNTQLAQAARQGGGYITYLSRQAEDKAPIARVAYAVPFAPWNWATSTGAYVQDVQRQALSFTLVMTLAGGALVIIVFGLSWLIGNNIINPLRKATHVAQGIANGKLDNDTHTTARDEPGQLLGSMGRMQLQLRAVIASQQELAHQHDLGTISHRIDEAAFPGQFRTMAAVVNACVAQHIKVKMRVVEVMRRYAIGDLSVDMDRLPGEKAVITQAMDATKASLSAINQEIKHLAAAAAAGDFSQRGEQDRYEHDFRQMVISLNQLMATCEGNLGQLSQLLRAIAGGDLTQTMQGQFNGVFAQMRDDANTTVANLTSIVGRIQQASSSITTAASEIANGNADLSQRTEQQAANLEETAASMEELTSTVRQNAGHARQAHQLSIGAAGVATEGGQVVEKVITTMGAIEQSSHRIADIISVIDSLAFQTNILALNAAVEAARAGEQGRGFAVVASEVRTLAQRSADAAKDIKSLIDDSVARVADGSALVNQAGSTMAEIVGSVQRVSDIVAEISAASQEQSSGIEQVSQTVTQMDQTTQQNAALVEETTAAARSMEEQAMQLAQAVSAFRLAAQPLAASSLARHSDKSASRVAGKPARGREHAAGNVLPAFVSEAIQAGSADDWHEF